MVFLEKNLLHLPRKCADPDFVDKLFQRIYREEVLVRLTVINDLNRFQCRQWQTIQNRPFMQRKEESAEVHFYLPPPRPGRKQSFSKIPRAGQNFLWATKEKQITQNVMSSECENFVFATQMEFAHFRLPNLNIH